jgi:Fe2+ transport system protein B
LLSASEKRFVRYWEEQRLGGRWSYYTLYIIIGTFIGTIIFSTFLFLFFQVVFGSLSFWVALLTAFLISSVATVYTWGYNEKRFKKIIRREIHDDRGAETP